MIIFQIATDENILIPLMSIETLKDISFRKLKLGKACDVYKLTVERLRYSGEETLLSVLKLINKIISHINCLSSEQLKTSIASIIFKGKDKLIISPDPGYSSFWSSSWRIYQTKVYFNYQCCLLNVSLRSQRAPPPCTFWTYHNRRSQAKWMSPKNAVWWLPNLYEKNNQSGGSPHCTACGDGSSSEDILHIISVCPSYEETRRKKCEELEKLYEENQTIYWQSRRS